MEMFGYKKGKMKHIIRAALSSFDFYSIVPKPIRIQKRSRFLRMQYAMWEKQGCAIPPPHAVKQWVLWMYAKKYQIHTFVETGTYQGAMISGLKDIFSKIYSIELSRELFEKAIKRFKTSRHITLLQGDSSIELGKVIPELAEPALFWLDAHYSAGITARGDKDTPVHEELKIILGNTDIEHIIVIDDARCFGKEPGYPSINDLRQYVDSMRPTAHFLVEADSIRILPSGK
jgi:hypothetical protein